MHKRGSQGVIPALSFAGDQTIGIKKMKSNDQFSSLFYGKPLSKKRKNKTKDRAWIINIRFEYKWHLWQLETCINLFRLLLDKEVEKDSSMLKVNRTARYAKVQPYLFEAIKVEFSVEGESHKKKLYIKKKRRVECRGKQRAQILLLKT